MENAGGRKQANSPVKNPRRNWWKWLVGYIKGKLQQRKAKKEKETAQDRAARLTANATVWIAGVTILMAIFNFLTLWEIHEGSADTHELATATSSSARAWVVVRETKFGYLKDASNIDRVSSIVGLTNTGPSPAFNVRGWRCAQVLPEEPPVTIELPSKYLRDCAVDDLGMIGRHVPQIMHVNDLSEVIPSGSLSNDMHGGGRHFYAWGYYTYEIVPNDKRRHFISFCLMNSDSQLGACTHGNSGD